MEIINKTKNGQIFKCNHCKAIHIEYKNLNFNFNNKQFDNFIKAIESIDGEKYEQLNEHSPFDRKIVVPTQQQNLNILLTGKELVELKLLLKKKDDNYYVIMASDMTFNCFKN